MLPRRSASGGFSFPRSAWECCLDAPRRAVAQDAERPGPAFPRGAWERDKQDKSSDLGTGLGGVQIFRFGNGAVADPPGSNTSKVLRFGRQP
jgi:hypothetical protein